MFGELVAFLRIANVPAQVLSDTSTVSFLVDELVPAGYVLWASAAGPGPLARPVGVISGDDGRQEGEEHDLDEHVLGVDSANFLWFAMGNNRLEWTGRTKRGPWVWEAIDDCSKHGREWTDYTIEGCGFGEKAGARSQDAGGGAFEVLPWVSTF